MNNFVFFCIALVLAHLALLTFADNLALLSGTLRTWQRAACDDQPVSLTCPQGTSISVQLAQYGNSAPQAASLCPPRHPPPSSGQLNTTCIWPNTMQYSLLQTVVEACQKKRACKFHASPKTFGGDPCPGVPKYVEVAYKCRPYEFRSKVACENDVVQLKCNPNSRIAIYSASYGRTEYESVQCPQPQGVPEETCLVSYATETVMQICHGKRRCTLSADAATFGNPCRKESRMYLKVVYNCVARKVLREQYEERPEEDERGWDEEGEDYVEEGWREGEFFSPSPNLAGRHNASGPRHPLPPTSQPHQPNSTLLHHPGKGYNNSLTHNFQNEIQSDSSNRLSFLDESDLPIVNCTVTITTTTEKSRVLGFISHWISTYHFLTNNKERVILYALVSVGGGLVVLLGLLVARLLWSRASRLPRPPPPHTTLGNGFTDDISDVDIDLTTVSSPPPPIHQPPAEVVRYGAEGSAPRSLSRSGNSQYYYG